MVWIFLFRGCFLHLPSGPDNTTEVQRRTPTRAAGGRSFESNRRGTRRKTPLGDSHVVKPQVLWNHECGQEQVRMAQTNGSLAGSGQHQRCGCMGRGSNSRCRPCQPKQGRREEKQSAQVPQHAQTRVNASKRIPLGTEACKQSKRQKRAVGPCSIKHAEKMDSRLLDLSTQESPGKAWKDCQENRWDTEKQLVDWHPHSSSLIDSRLPDACTVYFGVVERMN